MTKPLSGFRIVSLALNLPGPAALWRLRAMGASCIKLEPPGGDPMTGYSAPLYTELHRGIRCVRLDLKSEKGQARLHRELAKADLLLTAFRPSALKKLGLAWPALKARYPQLSLLEISGFAADAEVPGHDLTYLAAEDLLAAPSLPPSLFADMSGALMASERVLSIALSKQPQRVRVPLSSAAEWLAIPKRFALTGEGKLLGGAFAGYALYAAEDGWVALAALEPRFAMTLSRIVGLDSLESPSAAAQLKRWFKKQSLEKLQKLASAHDLPLHALRSNPSGSLTHPKLPARA